MLALWGLLKDLLVSVFMEANKTPAIEEEVDLEEGNLAEPKPLDYAGLYGLRNRDQGEAVDSDGESETDT